MDKPLTEIQKMTAAQAARTAKKLVRSNKPKGSDAYRVSVGLPPKPKNPTLRQRLTTISG